MMCLRLPACIMVDNNFCSKKSPPPPPSEALPPHPSRGGGYKGGKLLKKSAIFYPPLLSTMAEQRRGDASATNSSRVPPLRVLGWIFHLVSKLQVIRFIMVLLILELMALDLSTAEAILNFGIIGKGSKRYSFKH